MAALTTARVWDEIDKRMFAVISCVNPRGEPRSAGIVYVTNDRRLIIATATDSWKARHLRVNPQVAVTVTIAKHIPFMPWIQIPAATISFHGSTTVLSPDEANADVVHRLMGGLEDDPARRSETCVIAITPASSLATYGVGVGLREMRDRNKARGRVPAT
jgi:hypothetical protein